MNKLVTEEFTKDAGKPTENSVTSRGWKRNCEKDSSVEEKPEFKSTSELEGIVHDVILKDEKRMGQVQEVVEN